MHSVLIKGLTRNFGRFTAVDSLDLAVDDEVFGLLGPNGAGKTTTIKMLVTLLPPSSGHAEVDGLDIVKNNASVRKIIGYVPQMLSADASLTGYENIMISAKLYDVPKKEREEKVRVALGLMGLTEFGDKMVRTYSGGMIRRLEIAQASLHRPRVLFLDEPTVGLDPLARRTVWDMVLRLREEFGTTIFLTTHLMDEAEILCDRVAIMHKGRLIALGSPDELKARTGTGSLDEAFVRLTGDSIESGGSFRDVQRERRTARRLG